MTYATLMVNLEPGQTNAGILQIASDLAERYQSRVVGIAAAQPITAVYDEGYMSGDLIEQDLRRIEKEIRIIETAFRSAFHGSNRGVEWRSRMMYGPLSDYLANEARCADLIVTAAASGGMFNGTRRVDAGELVLQAGRPVLVVPSAAKSLTLEKVVICWRDTREARRAVCDALPLLKQANHVEVVEIAPETDMAACRSRLDDVVAWLKPNEISAVAFASPSRGDDREELKALVLDRNADLVVAGAYAQPPS